MDKTVIIGGGLSGLSLAHHLHTAGRHFQVLEARGRLGGRIKGLQDAGHTFDLGPSWYWPGQPRMAKLAADLDLTTYEQYAAGDLMFESANGDAQRGAGFSSMEGSWRIEGGMAAIIYQLSSQLPPSQVMLNAQVTNIAQNEVSLADGTKFHADNIVLACPPRVASNLTFTPDIDRAALGEIPTWMGGQAKFVATYDTPFWRDSGLSGDAMSRCGPLAEIHDASPNDATLGALFGFVGVPINVRAGHHDALVSAALDQLARLFGEQARTPRKAHLEDWAIQSETSSTADQQPLMAHPSYGLPSRLNGLWAGTLHFGATETAHDFGGYLEGALVRAETLANLLIN